ncbi:MAG: Uma2 family endonuclease, partial [Treponema sp.]|nr:Uma2 family endonuclease [Treponema sp.]
MSVAYAIREPETAVALPLRLQKARYTFADYVEWGDVDFWAEIIDGEMYMLGSPILAHQSISMDLSSQLYIFLKGKPCKVYAAPCAVRLFPKEDGSDDMVLQPDIFVVCDPAKLKNKQA